MVDVVVDRRFDGALFGVTDRTGGREGATDILWHVGISLTLLEDTGSDPAESDKGIRNEECVNGCCDDEEEGGGGGGGGGAFVYRPT